MKRLFYFLIMITLLSCSESSDQSNDNDTLGTNDNDLIENVDENLLDEDTEISEDTDNIEDTENINDADNIEDTEYIEDPDEMTLITKGSFWMGSPTDELGRESREILHYVELTKDFYMDRTEVTQASFNALMEYNPSYTKSCGEDCPVEWVNWHEALAYANERSKENGFEECFDCTGTAPKTIECTLKPEFAKPQDCLGYRLPTESEWEYAVRAGTDTAFYNGDITEEYKSPLDSNLDAIGWYAGNSSSTTAIYDCSEWFDGADKCGSQPVKGKLPNDFGLYDMNGNVYEWTMDLTGDYPAGTEENPSIDPSGAESGSERIIRGGGWGSDAYESRSGCRYEFSPTQRYFTFGFRLVRTK